MKKVILILAFLLISGLCFSQKIIEKNFTVGKNHNIELNFDFADNIKITTWNKNEVYCRVSVLINGGEDNNAYRLLTDKNGNALSLKSEYDDLKKLAKVHTKNCEDGNHSYCVDGKTVCMDIQYELKIPGDASLNVNTISGNIEIPEYATTINAKSISGFIDIGIAENSHATLKLNTITGEIFTDLDIEYQNQAKHKIVGQSIEGKLNSGGNGISLETISGNIYLRKH